MKKLLIGLTLLASMSSFATCEVRDLSIMQKNLTEDHKETINNLLELKGYNLSQRFENGMDITVGVQYQMPDQEQFQTLSQSQMEMAEDEETGEFREVSAKLSEEEKAENFEILKQQLEFAAVDHDTPIAKDSLIFMYKKGVTLFSKSTQVPLDSNDLKSLNQAVLDIPNCDAL